jgi:uncharacterized protein (DUF4415 family)
LELAGIYPHYLPRRNQSIKISPDLLERYEKRRLELEKSGTQDPEIPILPIEKWERGEIGKFYCPLKTPVSVRIDNEVLAWLKAQGDGHLTRINEILRQAMLADYKRR